VRLASSLAELADVAHAVLADPGVPAPEKWLLYRTLVELDDIDALARPQLGDRPLLGIASLYAPLVTVTRRGASGKAPAGARPLTDPALPAEARAALERAPLPLWPLTAGAAPEAAKRAEGRALELLGMLADPEAPAEPIARFPVPRQLPGTGGRLEVHVCVAAMSPTMRLMIDAGEGAAVALRSPAPPAAPALVAGSLPERGVLEPTSEWLVARFPAPESSERLRLSAVDLPGHGGDGTAMWILDLVVRKVP
jgi:hypothetical protein